MSTTREYVVIVGPEVERLFHVTAESRERAVELVAAGEKERDGEKVLHVHDKELGYEVVDSWEIRAGDV